MFLNWFVILLFFDVDYGLEVCAFFFLWNPKSSWNPSLLKVRIMFVGRRSSCSKTRRWWRLMITSRKLRIGSSIKLNKCTTIHKSFHRVPKISLKWRKDAILPRTFACSHYNCRDSKPVSTNHHHHHHHCLEFNNGYMTVMISLILSFGLNNFNLHKPGLNTKDLN